MNNKSRIREMWMVEERIAPEFGKIVARCLIVRALRRAGLRYALYGRSCMIAFVLPFAGDADIFVEVAQDILRSRSKDRYAADYKAVYLSKQKPVRKPTASDTDAVQMLAENSRLFIFVSDLAFLPPVIRSASDGIVELADPDIDVLKMAARAVTKHNVPDDMISAVAGEPLSLLNKAFKAKRDPGPIVRRLRRARDVVPDQQSVRPVSEQPTLDDLHGLGEAASGDASLQRTSMSFETGCCRGRT